MNAFDRVLIQDGSSFALQDNLAAVYPGRFNQYKPAAVELYTTRELFDGLPSQITLTPDTAPERDHRPTSEALCGSLLLADQGYFKWGDLNRLNRSNAAFIMRAYASINPRIIRAFDETGKRRVRLEGQLLKSVKHAPGRLLGLDVVRHQREGSDVMPLIVKERPGQQSPLIIVTNLARSRYSADTALAGGIAVQGIQGACRVARVADGRSAYCLRLDLGRRGRHLTTVYGASDSARPCPRDLQPAGRQGRVRRLDRLAQSAGRRSIRTHSTRVARGARPRSLWQAPRPGAFFGAPGRAHILGGASPLSARQGE